MPYPFTPTCTYAVLKERLENEFKCKHLKITGTIVDLKGVEHDVYYFERDFEGKKYRAVAPDLQPTDYALHSVTRSLCARLRIDPAKFGLDLG